MISEELKAIVDRFKKQGKMSFLEGATEEQITQLEKDHEISLPEKYKDWLLYSDGGELFLPAGVQLYGVARNPVTDVNENDRPDENYIVIGALASGDPVLCEKSGERISIYDHETGSIDDELIYDDFYAFLNDLYDLSGSIKVEAMGFHRFSDIWAIRNICQSFINDDGELDAYLLK